MVFINHMKFMIVVNSNEMKNSWNNHFLGFAILELTKLLMYETFYDKLQPCFGQRKLHLHYMKTDGFVLSVITKDIIKDLNKLEGIFGFSNFDEDY